jgi:radical SAM superfamily enzyme YgiQ (UPF0313 family)
MLWMGAESGSQKVLDAMEKGLTVADIRAANELLRGEGIEVGVFLQFGYPGETWADIEATLQLARELEPADIGRVGVVSLARHEVLRARESGTGREAELGRLERSVDDVSRHLRA